MANKEHSTWDGIRIVIADFMYDYQIAICVAFALIGFWVSISIINPKGAISKDGTNITPYGEIIIENSKELVSSLLKKRSAALTVAITRDEKVVKAGKNPNDGKIKEIVKRITILQTDLKQTQAEIKALDYGLVDKNPSYFYTYIFPDRQAFLNTLQMDSWAKHPTKVKLVRAQLIDPYAGLGEPYRESVYLKLKQNKREFLMNFVTDYPLFGIWIILTIAQMMLWFMLFPLLTGNIRDLKLKLGEFYCITVGSVLKNLIVPVAFITSSVVVLDRILADSTVIYDNYFMSGYNDKFRSYALVGYAIATYCFGTFLTLIRQVTDMDEKVKGKLDRKDPVLNDKYLALKEAFDNSFLASAIILSFLVLWVGITINAINSTEAIKFYGIVTGKPLIPEDFIYLMGLFHTVILLSFYIPAKLKFNSLSLTKQEDTATTGSSSPRKIFTLLAENLATLLVTTSPLLASLIQKLVGTELSTLIQ